MLSLKRIRDLNLWQIPLTAGQTYDIYRHDYSPTNLAYSGADNLYDAVFYVINTNNDGCLPE